jgi:hypothetical protein
MTANTVSLCATKRAGIQGNHRAAAGRPLARASGRSVVPWSKPLRMRNWRSLGLGISSTE